MDVRHKHVCGFDNCEAEICPVCEKPNFIWIEIDDHTKVIENARQRTGHKECVVTDHYQMCCPSCKVSNFLTL